MDRQEIMEYMAEWLGFESDDNGEYDINDYDWAAGCYVNGRWFSPGAVVEFIESII